MRPRSGGGVSLSKDGPYSGIHGDEPTLRYRSDDDDEMYMAQIAPRNASSSTMVLSGVQL
ncbi:hypothetical protein PISMIDRAFT_676051 [Pisolithus microcarpus 441]|uniref:Uncharacterized protein n=1 Tax=Pisolithus microcarpus 441 TaxID=765257 RepID=A0A0C9ZAG5_9AGAM|nr:hypothetical protein PISMIDRAFT_676051 [Pisolithus microcarpus 441]